MIRRALERWSLALALALNSASLFACQRHVDESLEIREVREPPPPVSLDVALVLSAKRHVDVGDNLELQLRVDNESEREVILVRPQIWSWAPTPRQPRYILEWTDEAGDAILDPLGFGFKGDCSVGEGLTRTDLVKVGSGRRVDIRDPHSPNREHEVMTTARPGVYSLRVRYVAVGIEGATPLQLRSNPVIVEIHGGDREMWACRAAQLAEDTHEHIDVELIDVEVVDEHPTLSWETVGSADGPAQWSQRMSVEFEPIGSPVRRLESSGERDESTLERRRIAMANAGVSLSPRADPSVSNALVVRGRVVSHTAREVLVMPTNAGNLLVWEDHRDDRSFACRDVGVCVFEVYGAHLRRDGSMAVGPVRLTHDAHSSDVPPLNEEWEHMCP